MDLSERYRDWLHVRAPDSVYPSGEAVPLNAAVARIVRDRNSHRGIGRRTALRELEAGAANQEFLEEIACIAGLEYLDLGWPVTATDLAPLTTLTRLRTLKIDSPRKIADFTPLLELPALERLFIANAKHMTTLDWLRPFRDRLTVLGVEGSLWTAQRLASLKPLEGFALEALFLTNTRVADKSLAPLHAMPNLQYLGTARFYPRAEFEALHKARPALECDWFRDEIWS